MGKTIEELEDELRMERAKSQSREDIEAIGERRAELQKQINRTRAKRKFSGVIRFGKAVGRTGRVIGKVAKNISAENKRRLEATAKRERARRTNTRKIAPRKKQRVQYNPLDNLMRM